MEFQGNFLNDFPELISNKFQLTIFLLKENKNKQIEKQEVKSI